MIKPEELELLDETIDQKLGEPWSIMIVNIASFDEADFVEIASTLVCMHS